jgi:hypothetical protein
MTDTFFVYECDRCGDRLLIGRAGVREEDEDALEGQPCWLNTGNGERCPGRVHLVEQRYIGKPRFE